jgi:hypothetical protein
MISALENKGTEKVWAIIEEYRNTMGELGKVPAAVLEKK